MARTGVTPLLAARVACGAYRVDERAIAEAIIRRLVGSGVLPAAQVAGGRAVGPAQGDLASGAGRDAA
jgi:hypothetical protein